MKNERISPYIYPGLKIAPNSELKHLLLCICNATEVDPAAVVKKSRERTLVTVRQIFCYIAHKTTGYSYREIGEAIRPDYNHATVLHSISQVEDMMKVKDRVFVLLWGKCKYLLPDDKNFVKNFTPQN